MSDLWHYHKYAHTFILIKSNRSNRIEQHTRNNPIVGRVLSLYNICRYAIDSTDFDECHGTCFDIFVYMSLCKPSLILCLHFSVVIVVYRTCVCGWLNIHTLIHISVSSWYKSHANLEAVYEYMSLYIYCFVLHFTFDFVFHFLVIRLSILDVQYA